MIVLAWGHLVVVTIEGTTKDPSWGNTILAVAAVTAAGIAAGTAIWRQREQLAADGERQQNQLDAESDRLQRQLDHDREMRLMDDLRVLVDEISKALGQAGEAVNRVRSLARKHVHDGTEPDEEYAEAIREARAISGTPLYELSERIELRLGELHPLAVALNENQKSFSNGLELLEEDLSTQKLREVGEEYKDSTQKYIDFTKEARAVMGIGEPPDPPAPT